MTFINLKNGQLHYNKIGSGSKILLCFHGFGQDKSAFNDWGILGNHYTIYAFDLFHHGESTSTSKNLSKSAWKYIISQFLEAEGISSFSVFGFSLGGRFSIATALNFPDRIHHLILAAPDGIFQTLWFKLATTPIIRHLFKYLMAHPDLLDKWLIIGQKGKVMNRYVADFVRKELGSEENRVRVFKSWNSFKPLGYSKAQLIRLFNKYPFERTIIVGEKDQIIRPEFILPIIDQMSGFDVIQLPLKHHQLVGHPIIELIPR